MPVSKGSCAGAGQALREAADLHTQGVFLWQGNTGAVERPAKSQQLWQEMLTSDQSSKQGMAWQPGHGTVWRLTVQGRAGHGMEEGHLFKGGAFHWLSGEV